MNQYLLSFILPLLSLLTFSMIVTAVWYMLTHKKHETKEGERHNVLMTNTKSIDATVKKVDKIIEEKIIPKLDEIYSLRQDDIIQCTTDGVLNGLKKIGLLNSYVSDDGDFFITGWEKNNTKVYFFLSIEKEEKDLTIQCFSQEVLSQNEEFLSDLLSLNDEYKIAGISIPKLKGRKLLKVQCMLDAPDNLISIKTLDFVISSLMETQLEIIALIDRYKISRSFIEPQETLKLIAESHKSSALAA